MAVSEIPELFESTFNGLKGLTDINTIVGDPITTPDGTTIIPVSRVSMGYAIGGYNKSDRNLPSDEKKTVTGGGGGGTTVVPIGFLVISNGDVKMINVDELSPFEKVMDTVPGIIEAIAKFFNKD